MMNKSEFEIPENFEDLKSGEDTLGGILETDGGETLVMAIVYGFPISKERIISSIQAQKEHDTGGGIGRGLKKLLLGNEEEKEAIETMSNMVLGIIKERSYVEETEGGYIPTAKLADYLKEKGWLTRREINEFKEAGIVDKDYSLY